MRQTHPGFDYIMRKVEENGWRDRRPMFEKDGYEIYFIDDEGFELTIRDPETRGYREIIRFTKIDVHSPLYVALLGKVIENAETIVSEYTDDG